MVAVVTELMVGGERSTQDDSIKGSARTLVSKLRLRALLQATDTFVLDNIFALIDGYICADYTRRPQLFPLAVARRTMHSRK